LEKQHGQHHVVEPVFVVETSFSQPVAIRPNWVVRDLNWDRDLAGKKPLGQANWQLAQVNLKINRVVGSPSILEHAGDDVPATVGSNRPGANYLAHSPICVGKTGVFLPNQRSLGNGVASDPNSDAYQKPAEVATPPAPRRQRPSENTVRETKPEKPKQRHQVIKPD
jgi:hypothetical protein